MFAPHTNEDIEIIYRAFCARSHNDSIGMDAKYACVCGTDKLTASIITVFGNRVRFGFDWL